MELDLLKLPKIALMRHSFPLHRKLFVSHFLATLLVSSAVGIFVYYTARTSLIEQLRNRLASSAALISREIDANALRDIRFSRDISKPDYIESLSTLRQMRRSNEDVAFLYVMRKTEEGEVVFVVDSDESEDQALPGRVYPGATKELLEGFERQSADRDFTTDVWGTFFSGYAPLKNGHGEFLVGIDMRADEVRNKLVSIHRAGIAGFVATLLLSWLLAAWLSRHFKRPIDAMVAQIQAVASGDYDKRLNMRRHDELNSLLSAINDMTSDLKKAREDNLRLAKSLDEAFSQDEKPGSAGE